jgi:hypothetical protein
MNLEDISREIKPDFEEAVAILREERDSPDMALNRLRDQFEPYSEEQLRKLLVGFVYCLGQSFIQNPR